MTLNSVDLPHPDGPITDRNSPGLTWKETLSTAVIGPSGVSKRTTISSATRMALFGTALNGIADLLAVSRHQGGHGGGVARFDTHVGDCDRGCMGRRNRLLGSGREFFNSCQGSKALCALRPRHPGKIDVGFGNPLTDPTVLHRAMADASHTLLVQLVIEERAIICDHDQ